MGSIRISQRTIRWRLLLRLTNFDFEVRYNLLDQESVAIKKIDLIKFLEAVIDGLGAAGRLADNSFRRRLTAPIMLDHRFKVSNADDNRRLDISSPQTADTSPANPTAPANTTAYNMQGLGALLTPATPSGQVLVIISGTLTDSATTVGEGIKLQLYYGPMVAGVAAPANAGAIPAAGCGLVR